jgi:hypothetical protein
MAVRRSELVLLAVVTGSLAAAFHSWVPLPWYESIVAGLLVGVLVTVAFHRRDAHLQTWRDIREVFGRRT